MTENQIRYFAKLRAAADRKQIENEHSSLFIAVSPTAKADHFFFAFLTGFT